MNLLARILRFLMYALVFVLGIKSFREPDLWWQLRTGEWILANGTVPHTDVFSYTFEGVKWVNIKWLSEVLFALVSRLAGPECIYLLQAVVNVLLLWVLLRTVKLFSQRHSLNLTWVEVVTAPLLLCLAAAAEYRMIGRPEMFSHLLAVVFIYLYERHRSTADKWLWALLPLQILWANIHEAFAVGWAIAAIYTVGAWLDYWLQARTKQALSKPLRLTLVSALLIPAVVVNPYGWVQLQSPANIFGQVFENKYTSELLDYHSLTYWTKEVYIAIGLLLLTLLGYIVMWLKQGKTANGTQLFLQKYGTAYCLLIGAFVYLAATAHRNVVFVSYALFPMAVVSLSTLLAQWNYTNQLFTKYTRAAYIKMIVLTLLAYGLVVSNKYYEWTNSRDRFGLEVLSTQNPSDAATYVQQQGIKGKCFSDYLTSSYLLWKLQPEFKTYIDLRDLDIFTPDFFGEFSAAVTFPDAFAALDSVQHFDYVVLYRPQFSALHTYLVYNSRFKLAHADAVACVYVPATDTLRSDVPFSSSSAVPVSGVANVVNHLANPLYSAFDYATADFNPQAASFYLNMNRLETARTYAFQSLARQQEPWMALGLLGDVYTRMGRETGNMALLDSAENFYRYSLQLQPDYAASLMGLGSLFFGKGQYMPALETLEKCATVDPQMLNAHLLIGECCKQMLPRGNEFLEKAIYHYNQANALNPDNPKIIYNLGALYFQAGNCDASVKYFEQIKGFAGLTPDESQSVNEFLRKCGK